MTRPLIDFASSKMLGQFTEDFTTTAAVGYDRAASRLLNEAGVVVALSASLEHVGNRLISPVSDDRQVCRRGTHSGI